MNQTKTRSFWKISGLLLLSALILSPVAYVSAAEDDGDVAIEHHRLHPRLGEVLEVDKDANTILVEARHPRWDEEEEEEDHTILIHYSDDTVIKDDREDADESAIDVGDEIIIRGERQDSDEYFAEIDADTIHVFDELKPKRLFQHKFRNREEV